LLLDSFRKIVSEKIVSEKIVSEKVKNMSSRSIGPPGKFVFFKKLENLAKIE
jgi:hypothetical protein